MQEVVRAMLICSIPEKDQWDAQFVTGSKYALTEANWRLSLSSFFGQIISTDRVNSNTFRFVAFVGETIGEFATWLGKRGIRGGISSNKKEPSPSSRVGPFRLQGDC